MMCVCHVCPSAYVDSTTLLYPPLDLSKQDRYESYGIVLTAFIIVNFRWNHPQCFLKRGKSWKSRADAAFFHYNACRVTCLLHKQRVPRFIFTEQNKPSQFLHRILFDNIDFALQSTINTSYIWQNIFLNRRKIKTIEASERRISLDSINDKNGVSFVAPTFKALWHKSLLKTHKRGLGEVELFSALGDSTVSAVNPQCAEFHQRAKADEWSQERQNGLWKQISHSAQRLVALYEHFNNPLCRTWTSYEVKRCNYLYHANQPWCQCDFLTGTHTRGSRWAAVAPVSGPTWRGGFFLMKAVISCTSSRVYRSPLLPLWLKAAGMAPQEHINCSTSSIKAEAEKLLLTLSFLPPLCDSHVHLVACINTQSNQHTHTYTYFF